MKKVLNYLSVIVLSLLMSQAGAENDSNFVSTAVAPYLEIGGAKFFNEEIGWGTCANSFLPIWQRDLSQLLFLQAKGNTAYGKQLSGSLKLGYRSLYGGDIGLFGIHGGYDYLHSRSGHNYHQLAFGIENWFLHCFTRVNIYFPFGKNHHQIGPDAHKYGFDFNGKEIPDLYALNRDIKKRLNLFHEHEEEGLFCGADAAVGYEFLPGLTITVGGYAETGKKPEFQMELKYQFDLKNQRILGLFDQITCETGLRRNCGKTSGYLGISLRVNCAKGVTLSGVARHLNDLVITREPQLSRYTVRENLGKEKENLLITVGAAGRNVLEVSDVNGIEYLPNSAGTLAGMGAYWLAVMTLAATNVRRGYQLESHKEIDSADAESPDHGGEGPNSAAGVIVSQNSNLAWNEDIRGAGYCEYLGKCWPSNSQCLDCKTFFDKSLEPYLPNSAPDFNANSTALVLYHGGSGLGQQRDVYQYSSQAVIDPKQPKEEIDSKADVVAFQNSTLTWKEGAQGAGYCEYLGKCWPSGSQCLDCKTYLDTPSKYSRWKYAIDPLPEAVLVFGEKAAVEFMYWFVPEREGSCGVLRDASKGLVAYIVKQGNRKLWCTWSVGGTKFCKDSPWSWLDASSTTVSCLFASAAGIKIEGETKLASLKLQQESAKKGIAYIFKVFTVDGTEERKKFFESMPGTVFGGALVDGLGWGIAKVCPASVTNYLKSRQNLNFVVKKLVPKSVSKGAVVYSINFWGRLRKTIPEPVKNGLSRVATGVYSVMTVITSIKVFKGWSGKSAWDRAKMVSVMISMIVTSALAILGWLGI